MRASVIVIAVALLFAGCIGQEEPIEESAADAPAPSSPSPTRPASPTATSPAAEETKDTPGEDEAEEEPPVTVTVSYATEGQVGASWCAPMGPNACMRVGPSLGEDHSWLKMEQAGTLTHATLTLAWEATSPTTEQLRFTLLRAKSCGEGCTEGEAVGDPVVGASPLILDLDVPAPAEGEWFDLTVRPVRMTPDPVYMWANLDQPFQVEGTLTLLMG